MTLLEFRQSRGFTLQESAEALGLRASSRSMLSRLENGLMRWPLILALKVERWSAGEVRALDLLEPEDADLLREALDRAGPDRVALSESRP